MKNRINFWSVAVLSAAGLLAPAAQAQIQVLGAGSSALWQTAAIAAYQQALSSGPGAGHYTVGGNCSAGACAFIQDNRGFNVRESGNLWVVWSADFSQIWAYISVDSTVGNRAFFSTPRATLVLDSALPGGQNRIATSLWGDGTADSAIPGPVISALNNQAFTAAFTDIRPEDAKFAEDRVECCLNPPNAGPYTPYRSAWSSAVATPVPFNIVGSDPVTNQPIAPFTTISVGASPIVFFVNLQDRTAGLGTINFYLTNVTSSNLAQVFSGASCDAGTLLNGAPGGPPVLTVQREPLSGTMNTTEFTTFLANSNPGRASQETRVNQAVDNPLFQSCLSGGGGRSRAVGTGDLVTAVKNNPSSVGYAFFSYGNFSGIANNLDYAYLAVDGANPITTGNTNGNFPSCNAPCPAAPGASFPNLRNGSYNKWSILRAVTDPAGQFATQALANSIQANINNTVPDFVPFSPVGGDPGLQLYRSHFSLPYDLPTISPSNGLPGGSPEAGGDVGGCVLPVGPAPGVLECRQ